MLSTMHPVAYFGVAAVHLLAGAVWLGAMFYSLFVLHPRARGYFKNSSEFESFILTVSHGARWKVIGALASIGLSGGLLLYERWPLLRSPLWVWLMCLKTLMFVAALLLFVYTSWSLWPRRVFAASEELPAVHRTFQRVGLMMILLASLSMILGVAAHKIIE